MSDYDYDSMSMDALLTGIERTAKESKQESKLTPEAEAEFDRSVNATLDIIKGSKQEIQKQATLSDNDNEVDRAVKVLQEVSDELFLFQVSKLLSPDTGIDKSMQKWKETREAYEDRNKRFGEIQQALNDNDFLEEMKKVDDKINEALANTNTRT